MVGNNLKHLLNQFFLLKLNAYSAYPTGYLSHSKENGKAEKYSSRKYILKFITAASLGQGLPLGRLPQDYEGATADMQLRKDVPLFFQSSYAI